MHPLIFFGSDRYSSVVLDQLIHYNHPPTLVVTTRPKPKKNHATLFPNLVEEMANKHILKVMYYQDNIDKLINYINQTKSIGLAASFPHLFPPSIITAFSKKLYNLHPSLLPQYRNVAPVPYAIIMGDKETGITLQHIDERIDTGRIVAQSVESILPTDTTSNLLTRLFTLGTDIFIKFLSNSPLSTINYQPSTPLVFTHKLTRQSGYIEWAVVKRLIDDQPIAKDDTTNPLVKLRLTHHPERTENILPDLIRGLEGYERVWTTVPQAELKRSREKGDISISLVLGEMRNSLFDIRILLPGKPRPISYNDFVKYYLE